MSRRRWLAWGVMVGLLVAGIGAGLLIGEGALADGELRETFLRLRAWRVANAMLAGAALAAGGVLVQGLFRNPLASPSILGTTAGASLGGVAVLLAWGMIGATGVTAHVPAELLLPLGCLAGAVFALSVLLAVAGREASVVSLLLTGFILSSFFLSISGLLTSLAMESFELGRAVVSFTLGGVEAKGARHAALAAPMVLAGALMSFGWARHLDALLSGEDEARSVGVDVDSVRRWIIIWTATFTAAAVAVGGNVGFVGLVVPHALRPFVGIEHRRLLPAALVGGATFLLWADILTRLIPSRANLPLGVVTGLIGAPVFLVLLAHAARQGQIE